MKSEFEIAITQLSADRNLSPEVIIEAIEASLVSAYKKNYGGSQAVRVTLDRHTGAAQVFVSHAVAEEPDEEEGQITLQEALKFDPKAQIGDIIEVETMPRNFGRIAAQTAKQVITQRIREAERDSVYQEYAERQGEIVTATVRDVDARSRNVVLNMGKAEALLPRAEQIPGERYRFNQRVRVYLVEVGKQGHGPQILVSRTHRDLLRRLLELEVPEITTGTVEVKAIAREPGARSKVAVAALQAGVDPVGSCVGMRGVRIQNIVNELNGEKIDVVAWDSDLEVFIANALSPAKVISVILDSAENTAKVIVPDRSLSLAIGKEGQNARLAAKLTGWRIDIKSEEEAAEELARVAAEREKAALKAAELAEARRAAAELLAQAEALMDDEEEQAEVAAELEVETSFEDQAEPVEDIVATAEPEELVMAIDPDDPFYTEEEQEEVVAPVPSVAPVPPVEPEPLELEPEEEESGDDDDESRSRRNRRDRTLEFDEQLGRVVARKKHKRNTTGRGNWHEEGWDE